MHGKDITLVGHCTNGLASRRDLTNLASLDSLSRCSHWKFTLIVLQEVVAEALNRKRDFGIAVVGEDPDFMIC